MKKITNSQARKHVENLIPFKGNNLSGVVEGRLYIVLSYGYWPLFAYDMVTNRWFENTDKYSVTTSKHRSQSKPLLHTTGMTLDEMNNLIKSAA